MGRGGGACLLRARTTEDRLDGGPHARQMAVDRPALAELAVLDVTHVGRGGTALAQACEAGAVLAVGREAVRAAHARHRLCSVQHICMNHTLRRCGLRRCERTGAATELSDMAHVHRVCCGGGRRHILPWRTPPPLRAGDDEAVRTNGLQGLSLWRC